MHQPNPTEPATRTRVTLAASQLKEVEDLYTAGLMIQACEAALRAGPLEAWESPAAKIMAARIARNVGAPSLARSLIRLAFREQPKDPQAIYYRSAEIMERRGPFAAWEFTRAFGRLEGADPVARVDWLGHLAEIASGFRDFDAADSFIAQAAEIAEPTPWHYLLKARVLEAQDRYEESLQAARQSLAKDSWYRPGIQGVAHLLQVLDRDDQALQLLTEASQKIENGPVVWQLAALQLDLNQYDQAWESLAQIPRLMPLMEPAVTKALAHLRSEVAYGRGDIPQAIQLARDSGNKFMSNIADRLSAAPPDAKRVVLHLPFVRQHHLTCAPATFSAISRFWDMPADHLAVAEAVCYDGTPAHSERRWAEQHGWAVREFTITWDSALALIDRGIPFTLSTTEATSGHIQAVIGYDQRRRTLLVRDPFRYFQAEFDADATFARYASTGPRGFAFVPAQKSAALDDLALPDTQLYDLFSQLLGALDRHDRPSAAAAWEKMDTREPDHRLTLEARRSLASYDGDLLTEIEIIERQLAKFPEDPRLTFFKLNLLRALGRRPEQMELLEKRCRSPHSHPIFNKELADELAADAREYPRAIRLLRKALYRQAQTGAALHGLAGRYWDLLDRSRSLELYRLAASLDDRNETAARSYFVASRYLRKTDEVLSFLQARFARFAGQSSQPARTLSWALDALGRGSEATAVLDEALRRRPDNAALMLFIVSQQRRHGGEKAPALLKAAEGKAHPAEWLRAAATLARASADLPKSLALWRQVLETQPLALDAHESVALLIAQTKSTAEALQFLESACARFPHNVPLARLRIHWLERDSAEVAEPVIQALVQQRPEDAWSHRELAIVLQRLRRYEDAAAEAGIGLRLEPNSPTSHHILGAALAKLNRLDEARDHWRQAISISVDHRFAINELVESFEAPARRRDALRFVHDELVRQVIFGDGLLAYRDQASLTLQPTELLADLREALNARPDLWQAWSAVVGQLAAMDQLDEALELARKSTDRFALNSRVWQDHAYVHQMRGDHSGEIDALAECLRIAPAHSAASRQMAGALTRDGRLREAWRALKNAVDRDSLDGATHASIADLLWRMNKRRGAIAFAGRAVLLEPGLLKTWDSLRRWTAACNRPGDAVQLARRLTERRAGESRSWQILARVLDAKKSRDERLAACDKAMVLSPRSVDIADLKASLLAEDGRFADAIAVCRLPEFGDPPPLALAGREAWLLERTGESAQAFKKMEAILHDEPKYYWGWQVLCEWLANGQNAEKFLTAARDMVKNFPNDVRALNTLSEAQFRSRKKPDGKATLARVLAISPTNEFAGYRLFDVQLGDRQFDEAEKTLELLRKHQDGHWVRQREIVLASHRGEKQRAADLLSSATQWAFADPPPFDAAISELDKIGMLETGDQTLEQLISPRFREAPVPGEIHFTESWMKRFASRKDWRQCRRILRTLKPRNDLWLAAMTAYLNGLATGNKPLSIRLILWRNAKQLRSSTPAWGAMGYALCNIARRSSGHRRAVRWLRDFESPTDLRPWMLSNLAVSLRYLNRTKQALDASRKALTLNPDHTTDWHIVWIALDELLAAQPGDGVARFAAVPRNKLPKRQQFLAALAQLLIDFDRDIKTSPKGAAARARAELIAAERSHPVSQQILELKRAGRRTARRIAKTAGGVNLHLWAFFRKRMKVR